jgi:hypothetical protein
LQERRIAHHHQRRTGMAGQQFAARHHGMAGAQLLGLQGEGHARPPGKRLAHQIRPIAHHHDRPLDADLGQRVQHVVYHRSAADGHQDLRQVAFHAGALARGQHNRNRFQHIRLSQVVGDYCRRRHPPRRSAAPAAYLAMNGPTLPGGGGKE